MPIPHLTPPAPSPGFLRRLLVGAGPKAVTAGRIIGENGAVDSRLIEHTPGVLNKVKSLFFGHRPFDVLGQRYTQGGVLGKGGLLHGSVAFDPSFLEKARTHGWGPTIANNKLEFLGNLSAPAMGLGIPAYAMYKAKQRGEGVGNIVGENLGFMVGGPMGLVGAVTGSNIGHQLGALVDSPHAPPMPQEQPPQPYPEQQLPPEYYQEAYDMGKQAALSCTPLTSRYSYLND